MKPMRSFCSTVRFSPPPVEPRSLMMQRMMIDRAGITSVFEIDSGHLPYLTQPAALATILDGLAG
jgi:hypothetical protein